VHLAFLGRRRSLSQLLHLLFVQADEHHFEHSGHWICRRKLDLTATVEFDTVSDLSPSLPGTRAVRSLYTSHLVVRPYQSHAAHFLSTPPSLGSCLHVLLLSADTRSLRSISTTTLLREHVPWTTSLLHRAQGRFAQRPIYQQAIDFGDLPLGVVTGLNVLAAT
jgi:hypothetical protein